VLARLLTFSTILVYIQIAKTVRADCPIIFFFLHSAMRFEHRWGEMQYDTASAGEFEVAAVELYMLHKATWDWIFTAAATTTNLIRSWMLQICSCTASCASTQCSSPLMQEKINRNKNYNLHRIIIGICWPNQMLRARASSNLCDLKSVGTGSWSENIELTHMVLQSVSVCFKANIMASEQVLPESGSVWTWTCITACKGWGTLYL
jgi:hypothetical protein